MVKKKAQKAPQQHTSSRLLLFYSFVIPSKSTIQHTSSLLLFFCSYVISSKATSDELKPKAKHFALRYVPVRDEHARLRFCPSNFQRAD